MSAGESSPLPLLEYNRRCRILVVAPQRHPVTQGFGARTLFMIWAADIAHKLGAVLALDDSFWSPGPLTGPRYFHFGNDINWAWKLFPFANASSATRHLPAEMTDVRQTLSVDTLLKSWKCGHIYKLQTSVIFSCGQAARWCQARMMGAMDRMFSVISSVPTQFLRDKWAKRWNTSEPVTAIWHIRTGDITLPLRRSAAALIKRTIDKSFPRRGVRHVLVTFQSSILKTTFPWFESDLSIHEVLDSKKLADEQAFEMMLQAEVVVSTGSSFAHIPTGLAEPGRQIHMYLPPKNMIEMRGADVCCISNSCECEGSLICPGNSTPPELHGATILKPEAQTSKFNYLTRTHQEWMGAFVRKNTVPVTCSGNVFDEYAYKLQQLAAGLDSESGKAEPAIANLHYEGWMR
jgi:hypothetical protein